MDEDISILIHQKLVGNKWADMVKLLPGRTENSVKIRWKSIKRQVLALQAEQEEKLAKSTGGTCDENGITELKKRKSKRNTMDQDRLLKLIKFA